MSCQLVGSLVRKKLLKIIVIDSSIHEELYQTPDNAAEFSKLA